MCRLEYTPLFFFATNHLDRGAYLDCHDRINWRLL
jgi:hypothetical protein